MSVEATHTLALLKALVLKVDQSKLVYEDVLEIAHNWIAGLESMQLSAAKVQKTPVKEAALTCRTKNILLIEKIEFVEDAQAMTNRELLRLPGLGRRSLKELREWKPS